MENEQITDVNCIMKIFENNKVVILNENNRFFFMANNVGKVLGLTNIRASIQNYDDDERVVKDIDTLGGKQNVIFLTSDGIYRLLYNSTKPEAKKFRKWASKILNDVNFNNCQEIKKSLSLPEEKTIIQNDLYSETNFYIRIRLPDKYISKISKEKDLNINVIKPGIAFSLRKRNYVYNEEITDNGYFVFSFSMNSRTEAESIEKVYKIKFKDITVYGSTEYLDTTKLAKKLNFTNFVPNCYESYLKLSKMLFDYIVELIKFNFTGYENNYGYMYILEEKIDSQLKLNFSQTITPTNTTITTTRKELTKVIENIDNGFLFIAQNPAIKNQYTVGVTDKNHVNSEYLFTYESKMAKKIEYFLVEFLLKSFVLPEKWFNIEYSKMKNIVDFAINTYENYKIDVTVDNLNEFVCKYKSKSITHSKTDKFFEEHIYQKYVEDNIVYGENLKVSNNLIYNDFFIFITNNNFTQKFNMKLENDNWSYDFTKELLTNIEKITNIKRSQGVTMKSRGFNFANVTGFKGFELKSMEGDLDFFNEEIYKQYINEHMKKTDDNRNKVSKHELVSDFVEWTKKYNFTSINDIFYKKTYSMIFCTSLIKNIEKILNVTFDYTVNKQDKVGCFVGVTHINFPFTSYNFVSNNSTEEKVKKKLKIWTETESKISSVYKYILEHGEITTEHVKTIIQLNNCYLVHKRSYHNLIFVKHGNTWRLSELAKKIQQELAATTTK